MYIVRSRKLYVCEAISDENDIFLVLHSHLGEYTPSLGFTYTYIGGIQAKAGRRSNDGPATYGLLIAGGLNVVRPPGGRSEFLA